MISGIGYGAWCLGNWSDSMIPRFSAFIEVTILGVYSNNIYNEYTHGNDISETYV